MPEFDSEGHSNEPRSLVLAWWNTSLSPLGEHRAKADEKEFVTQLVRGFFERLSVDILALGEVTIQDVMEIHGAIGNPNVSYHDAAQGRSDIGVLYNRKRLTIAESKAILDSYGKSTLKVGEQITFVLRDTKEYFYLLVSHWPSRLYCSENNPRRFEIGMSLRKVLDEIRNMSREPYIVLMGDYNDDPCSPSLASHLLATRDRTLAKQKEQFLYNPFWRKLGESDPLGQGVSSICGTYFYRSGEHTRWHTFDQIIFSSAFLNGKSLSLNEALTQIVRSEELENLLTGPSIFDHLPVISVIDIRSQ